ncbi:RNA polymerase sigma-70 factor [bacterium]|nr:RNA polymerase sigma-70 factor [bacterium]
MVDVEHPEGSAPPDDGLAAFVAARRRLFGIAYRMLGSAAEAEDVVQDTWMRWQTTDRSAVRDPAAFLATTTTRLAINVAESARSRREAYVGPWLPEPVDTSTDPKLGAERGEALELAVLMLLENLSPTERAAYVLREAFDYSYRQIGEILRLEEANARQLAKRARTHIANRRPAQASAADQRRLLTAFVAAAQTGEVAPLEAVFAADIVSYSDGGGFVRAARRPVSGRTRVARFVAAVASHFWSGVTLDWIETNGQWSALIRRDDDAIGLLTVTASPRGIHQLMWMMRPSKLITLVRSPARGE